MQQEVAVTWYLEFSGLASDQISENQPSEPKI